MKEASVDIGKLYALRSQTGGEVTNENGETLATLEANKQQHITAQESVWLVPDDCKVTKANFKYALAALGLLGGGSILPAGYTRLEYLESTGKQVIDVPVTIDCARSIITWEGNLLAIEGNHHAWAIGVQTSEGAMKTGLRVQGQNAAGEYYLNFMKPSTAWDLLPLGLYKKGEMYKITADYAAGKIYIDVEAKGSFTPQNYKFVGDCGLFAHRWNPSTADGTIHTDYWRGRASHFSISSNGQNERHFIPALDPTGAPCMFDTVTRTAFYNSGTGDFVTPQSGARTYSLRGRRVLPDLGKLSPTGLRRLYHTPAYYEGELYDYALEHGYKPIVETEQPEDGYWMPVWHDREEIIELEWVETEPPAEEELSTFE